MMDRAQRIRSKKSAKRFYRKVERQSASGPHRRKEPSPSHGSNDDDGPTQKRVDDWKRFISHARENWHAPLFAGSIKLCGRESAIAVRHEVEAAHLDCVTAIAIGEDGQTELVVVAKECAVGKLIDIGFLRFKKVIVDGALCELVRCHTSFGNRLSRMANSKIPLSRIQKDEWINEMMDDFERFELTDEEAKSQPLQSDVEAFGIFCADGALRLSTFPEPWVASHGSMTIPEEE